MTPAQRQAGRATSGAFPIYSCPGRSRPRQSFPAWHGAAPASSTEPVANAPAMKIFILAAWTPVAMIFAGTTEQHPAISIDQIWAVRPKLASDLPPHRRKPPAPRLDALRIRSHAWAIICGGGRILRFEVVESMDAVVPSLGPQRSAAPS